MIKNAKRLTQRQTQTEIFCLSIWYKFTTDLILLLFKKQNLKNYHFLRSFLKTFYRVNTKKQKQLKSTQHALYIMIYELLTEKM